MASHRDQLIGLDRQGMDGARITEARSGLTEAVTELQRLTRGPLFSAMPRVLADLDNAPRGSSVSVETVRMLRQCSAEHLRVADELEVAARRCRLVEEEIGQRIDALLAGWDKVLGLDLEREAIADWAPSEEMRALMKERDEARAAKDYATSDRIREHLTSMGLEVMDTAAGTQVRPRD